MKICVYAICKNEKDNIRSWVQNMSEADDIYVLDTGSTDGSYKLLKKENIYVKRKKYKNFRFDNARNDSLNMIKKEYDLYVCTDLDERFNKGWRKILEENYNKDYNRVSYLYNWSFDENGKPSTTFYLNKIHTKDYIWNHPVHEVLFYKDEKQMVIDNIVLNHYQKEKESRSNYLPLLELSVKESPLDDRNMHYLGREYMYYGYYDKAIETLHKHLKLESATWKDERCASYRYIARCYKEKNYYEESFLFYNLAIDEAPYLRESYIELAYLLYILGKYEEAIINLDKAFLILEKSKSYINESFAWNDYPYDLYSLCLFELKDYINAKKYSDIALYLNPNNERLILNNSLINKFCMHNHL